MLDDYVDLIDRIKRANKQAEVIFLECPYYSTYIYNKTIKQEATDNIRSAKTVTKKGKTIKVVCKKQYHQLVINKIKNQRNIAFQSQADKELHSLVDYYNERIQKLNTYQSPRISLDIIDGRKGRKKAKTVYRKNFKLYVDGIHPGTTLARLWLFKFIELAVEIEAQILAC